MQFGHLPKYTANLAILLFVISSFGLWTLTGADLIQNFKFRDFSKPADTNFPPLNNEIRGIVLSATSEADVNEKLDVESSSLAASLQEHSLSPNAEISKDKILAENTNREGVVNNEEGLVGVVNSYRGKNGLGMLAASSDVCAFSSQRLSELHVDYSHNGFDEVASKLGRSSTAENIASTGNDVGGEYVVEGMWAKSDGHNKNMLGDFSEGCGYYDGEYAVFLFAK